MAGSKKEIGTGFITEVDRYLFNNGRHYEIFEKMGAHPKKYKGKNGMYFAVWAPHAEQIGVVGDFNSWDPEANAMNLWRIQASGRHLSLASLQESYTNTPSQRKAAKSYSRQIPMRSARNTAPVPLPLPPISRTSSGETTPG